MSGGYDFSQLFHANTLSFSPGTTFIATAHLNRIVVRSTSTLQIVRTWLCTKPVEATTSHHLKFNASNGEEQFLIDSLQWSSDSLYLLVHSNQAKMAWVYGLAKEGAIAQIGGMGIEGLSRVEWGKSGRDILAWAELDSKLSIYDLTNGDLKVIQGVKPSRECLTYSPDFRHMAIVEKHLGKEYMGVYDVLDGYCQIRHFTLLTTDAQGVSWSPCGKYIAVRDTLLSYSLYIHSPLGPQLSHFDPTSATYDQKPDEMAGLGIRTLAWAPGGRWIALGGWDGKVRIVESEGWRCMCTISMGNKVVDRSVTVWREPVDWFKDTRGRGIVQFNRQPCPSIIPTIRQDLTKPCPKMGISQLSFDREATLLLIRLENQPHVMHVHSFLPTPTAEQPVVKHLVSLVFEREIKKARWCPDGRKIGVVNRGGGVYFWDHEAQWVEEDVSLDPSKRVADPHGLEGGMMEGVGIPTRTEFSALDIQWSSDGKVVAIQDSAQTCLLYEGDPEDNDKPDTQDFDRSALMWNGSDEGLTHVKEEEEEDFSLDMRDYLHQSGYDQQMVEC